MTKLTTRFVPTSFASNIQNTRDSNIHQADRALYSPNSDFRFENGASFKCGLKVGELSLIPLDYVIYRRQTVLDCAYNWWVKHLKYVNLSETANDIPKPLVSAYLRTKYAHSV